MSPQSSVLIFLCLILSYCKALADQQPLPNTKSLPDMEVFYIDDSDANLPQKNYITYEFAKNTPLIQTEDELTGGHVTYIIGYRHNMNEQWMMGLSFGYKSFFSKEKNKEEHAFATLSHEALYIIPLYYPLNFLIGPKFLYLLPVKQSKFPLTKNSEADTELGVAISCSITYEFTRRIVLSARVDRWRGTTTNRFHGTEVAFGLNYKL